MKPARLFASLFDITVPRQARFEVEASSSDVHVRGVVGEQKIEGFSRSIALRVPAGANAALAFDSFSGKLTSDVPLAVSEQRKGHLRGALGGGGAQHTVRLKTFSGDVKISR